MIRYLTHNEIDKKKWDKTIQHAFNGNIYACSWYLDIIHPYWNALVEDDYQQVMPLPINEKWNIKYMLHPFFSQQLGVFSKTLLYPDKVTEFINAIPNDVKYIEINFNSFNKIVKDSGILIPHKNHLVDLINTYARTQKHYSTNLKRNLKKSVKANITLHKTTKPEEVVTLFRKNRGKQVKQWNDHHYLRLQHLMYMSIHKGKGIIYGAYSERNTLLAGVFFLKSHNRLTFLFSGQSEEGKKVSAMAFIIDSVIRQFSPGNYTLDFEGSDNEGLARFYKSFGAVETLYYGLKINKLPFPLSALYKIKKLF
ncbi:MAG: hypothetical protein DRJ09_04450 [Bacteroidetes bacterium]|nr:MAG: hypothetical protein DRJ09_04450 [Bacteroidota bacterium]